MFIGRAIKVFSLVVVLSAGKCGPFEAAKVNSIVFTRNDGAFAASTEFPNKPVPLRRLDGIFPQDHHATPVADADTTAFPHTHVGRLQTATGTCSATLIENTNVLVTAAHCVYLGSDWIDIRQFQLRHGGDTPLNFDWECMAVGTLWTNSNPGESVSLEQVAVDIAFVRLRNVPGNELANLNISSSVPQTVSISGYPANHHGAERMVTGMTDVGTGAEGVLTTAIDMGPGASGSGWISGNGIHGVTSSEGNAGDFFGAPVTAFGNKLFNFVNRDCPENEGTRTSELELEGDYIEQAILLEPTKDERLYNVRDVVLRRRSDKSDSNFIQNTRSPIFSWMKTAHENDRQLQLHLVSNHLGLDCSFQCQQSSPLCNSVPLPTEATGELHQLADLFRPMQSVAKEDIMKIFKQNKDECERSDVEIIGDRFHNTSTSDKCVAKTEYDFGSEGSPVLVEVLIGLPKIISGNIVQKDGEIGGLFDEQKGPLILFDGDPQSLYSGPVEQLYTNGNAVVASIGGSCLLMGPN